ncbi:MAG: hypothetical protein U0X20_07400 [Caldilineaceae bacterium]
MRRRSAGRQQKSVNGAPAQIHSMADSLYKYRIGYVSGESQGKGTHPRRIVKTNIAVTVWSRLRGRLGAINLAEEDAVAHEYMQALEVRATG